MKKILVRIVIGIAALVVVALVVVFLSLNTIVKKGVDTVGPMITKTEVTLGSAQISPFSGSGRLTKLFVGNPQGFKSPSAMQVGDLKVGVQLGSLTSDTIVVNELNVQNAEVTLEGSLNNNNLTKLMDNINGSSSEAGSQPKPKNAPPQPGASKSSKKFIVKEIVIQGTKAHLDLNIPGLGNKTMTIPMVPIHLQNIGVAENGVTAEQLSQAIMKAVLGSVTEAATQQIANLGGDLKNIGKDLGKDGTQTIGNAAKSITDLFKKKQ